MFNRLSPIWGAVLGFWIPIAFLRNVDGYVHINRWHETLFVYATGWTVNAVWVALFCGVYLLAWLALRALPRPTWDRSFDFVTVAFGRFLHLLSMLTMIAEWLGVRRAGIVPLLPDLEFAVPVLIAIAVTATIRNASPGPLLLLTRRVAKWSSIALLIAPISALIEWRDAHPAPDPLEARRGARPDVVLITVDTLSANRMSLYGHSRPTTPRLESLAQAATVFDRMYANSNYTTSSVSSLMLGVRPWTHRSLQLFSRPLDGAVEHNVLRKFDEAGYRVITVDTNYHASPTQQRLRRWVDHSASAQVQSFTYNALYLGRWLPHFGAGSGMGFTSWIVPSFERLCVAMGWLSESGHFDPAIAFGEARRLWAESAEAPRFLWVHLYGPHEPYAATKPFLGAFDDSPARRTRFNSIPPYLFSAAGRPEFPEAWGARYDEGVLMTDHEVGEFIDWLKARGEFDDAVLVLTADHGESFGHDYGGHGGPMMWEDLVRIPLLVKQRGQHTGRRNATVVEQVDIAPTLLALAGLPAEPAYEGTVAPLDATRAGSDAWSMNLEQSPRFGPLSNGSIALIGDRWKYVGHFGWQHYPRMPELADALYDLQSDPRETRNLAAQQPDLAARMRQAIEAELKAHAAPVR